MKTAWVTGNGRRILLTGLVLALLIGCTADHRLPVDLTRYPQQLAALLAPETANRRLIEPDLQSVLNADYDQRFFSPWRSTSPPLPAAKVFWGVKSYADQTGYGQNLLPLSAEEWQVLVAAQQIDRYPSLDRTAITIRNADLRVMPTRRPFFFDPSQAGEGYPFDYFQNSAVWVGTPLRVTHRSADGAWYLVEAGYAYGWLSADALAWTNSDFNADYQTGRYAAILRDDQTLTEADGTFLAQGHIGALFPVAEESAAGWRLLVPVRDADARATLRTATISTENAAVKPLLLTPAALARIADRMIGRPYGWGGLNQDRDCSSTLRDLFTPFGIWLPRNSSQQAQQTGRLITLNGLTSQQKRSRLLAEGRPFTTLLWFPGHIGLYLGPSPSDNQPLLLHAVWGVPTKDWLGRERRLLIGRLAITSFQPGAERPGVSAEGLWKKLLGFSLLPRELSELSDESPTPHG